MKKTDIERIEDDFISMIQKSGVYYGTYGWLNETGDVVKIDVIKQFIRYLDDLRKEAE